MQVFLFWEEEFKHEKKIVIFVYREEQCKCWGLTMFGSQTSLNSVHWHAFQGYHTMSEPCCVLFALNKVQKAGIILRGS